MNTMQNKNLALRDSTYIPLITAFLLGICGWICLLPGLYHVPTLTEAIFVWLPAGLLILAAVLCAVFAQRGYTAVLVPLYLYFILLWGSAFGLPNLTESAAAFSVYIAGVSSRELFFCGVLCAIDLAVFILFSFADRSILWKRCALLVCFADIVLVCLCHTVFRNTLAALSPQGELHISVLFCLFLLLCGLTDPAKKKNVSPVIASVAGGLYLVCFIFWQVRQIFFPDAQSLFSSLDIRFIYVGQICCWFAFLIAWEHSGRRNFTAFRWIAVVFFALQCWARAWQILPGTMQNVAFLRTEWTAALLYSLADGLTVLFFCFACRSRLWRNLAVACCTFLCILTLLNLHDMYALPLLDCIIYAVMALAAICLAFDSPQKRMRVNLPALLGVLTGCGICAVGGYYMYRSVTGSGFLSEEAILSWGLLAVGILLICLCARHISRRKAVPVPDGIPDSEEAVISKEDPESQEISVPEAFPAAEETDAPQTASEPNTVSSPETDDSQKEPPGTEQIPENDMISVDTESDSCRTGEGSDSAQPTHFESQSEMYASLLAKLERLRQEPPSEKPTEESNVNTSPHGDA